MYQLTNGSDVFRLADKCCIPADNGNVDRQAYNDWCAKGNTPAPAAATPELSAIQQIRALEQANADDQAKLNRQTSLKVALDIACASPAALGKTRDQVHALWYAANAGYKKACDLEQQISVLRKLL